MKSISILAILAILQLSIWPVFMFMDYQRARNTKYSIFMAGFGNGSGSSTSKAPLKLKPKAQWDRYTDLKKATPYPVAVRVVRQDQDKTTLSDWMEVGKIRSENDEFTDMAVAAQRALLAEHAKRLFPLHIAPKDKVEWAFFSSDEWVAVTSNIKDIPTGIERKVGFEGTPDPSSGFYCHYVDGRLE